MKQVASFTFTVNNNYFYFCVLHDFVCSFFINNNYYDSTTSNFFA